MALTYNYSNDYEMTAGESSGESGSVVLCQSMYIPVETSEPGVTSGLLQLVNEMFFCLFLSHFQNLSISGGREGERGREGGRGGGQRESGREEGKERERGRREMMETAEVLKMLTTYILGVKIFAVI